MTRALCSKSSKRKTQKPSQDNVSEDSKENSPSILSQASLKKLSSNVKSCTAFKENVSPKLPKCTSANNTKEFHSPLRKSLRRQKTPFAEQSTFIKNKTEKSVLCDKTNTSSIKENKHNENTCDILKTIENKKEILHKLITIPKPNISIPVGKGLSNNVPVYKPVSTEDIKSKCVILPEKNEAVYEFEVDENEEPTQKKKRKKRIYKRKPKTGPKALTINNIKYSSSESLVSLPEKPVTHKKRTVKARKSQLKPYSSVNNLNDSENSCYSVKSFMSHPTLLVGENRNAKTNNELSVLYETQSEQSQTPIHHVDCNTYLGPDFNLDLPFDPSHSPNCINTNAVSNVKCQSISHDAHFSPNPRCYKPKIDHASIRSYHSTDNMSHNVNFDMTNVSSSPRDFLSSTPCKRISNIVCNNSVFDNSDDLPQGLRPSTGFVKEASSLANITDDNCFGFDEPEELEEPLVSPIKSNIDLPRKPLKPFPREFQEDEIDQPKPSVEEIIKLLKATISKSNAQENSNVFNTSSEHHNPPHKENVCNETAVHFKKPARKSYERQRRVRYYSENEEDKELSEDDGGKETASPEPIKKCYKKINTTKPPKLTKAKQKIAKEEEELERLAAQMNAQFEKIDQVNLVVE